MSALTLYARLFAVTILLFALGLLLPGCATSSTPATSSGWNSATLSGMTPYKPSLKDIPEQHAEVCRALVAAAGGTYDAITNGFPPDAARMLFAAAYPDRQPGPFSIATLESAIKVAQQGNASKLALELAVMNECRRVSDIRDFIR